MHPKAQHQASRGSRDCGLVLLLLLLLMPASRVFGASSSSFQLQGQTSAIGTSTAGSSAFRLQSCVSTAPVGTGTSTSFRLQSGCITVLQAASDPVSPPRPFVQVPVPLNGAWALLLLTLALLFVAQRSLRSRVHHTV